MGPDDAGKPLTRAFRPLPEALVFSAYPFSQVEVDPTQTLIERRFVEVTVVIDPTPDIRIAHSGQVIEGLVGLGLKAPAPDITAELLERLIGCRRQERDAVFAAATVHPLQPLPVGLHLLEGLPDFPLRDVERLCLGHAAPPVTGWPPTSAGHRSPFGPVPLQNLHPYYGLLRPCAPHRYSGSCGGLPLELLPWHRGDRFPRSTKEPDPGSRRLQAGRRSGRASGLRPNSSQGPLPSPWFRHRPVNFGTSSAVRLRSSLRISPDGIKSRLFLRRSPPPLLTAAARSGLKPAPDRRLRGACPHLFCRSTPPLQSVCSRRTQWASLNFGFRPFAALQDRPSERAGSTRKRTLAEGVGCAKRRLCCLRQKRQNKRPPGGRSQCRVGLDDRTPSDANLEFSLSARNRVDRGSVLRFEFEAIDYCQRGLDAPVCLYAPVCLFAFHFDRSGICRIRPEPRGG